MDNFYKISKKIRENIDRIKDKKVIIFPFGKVGYSVNEILNKQFDIQADVIIDNELSNYNSNISKINILNNLKLEDYIIIFSSERSQLLDDILKYNNNFKNILIIYEETLLSYKTFNKIVNEINFKTLLDVGCGKGIHAKMFADMGKQVTAITLENDRGYDGVFIKDYGELIIGSFLDISIDRVYDVIWVSHVLEHVEDIDGFLRKVKDVIKPGGTLAITVPSREKNITLTHIHNFNGGRLLRYLLFAGFDVRNAEILEYGFNLSIVLKDVKYLDENLDNNRLFEFLPKGIEVNLTWDNMPYFDGDIKELNWYK